MIEATKFVWYSIFYSVICRVWFLCLWCLFDFDRWLIFVFVVFVRVRRSRSRICNWWSDCFSVLFFWRQRWVIIVFWGLNAQHPHLSERFGCEMWWSCLVHWLSGMSISVVLVVVRFDVCLPSISFFMICTIIFFQRFMRCHFHRSLNHQFWRRRGVKPIKFCAHLNQIKLKMFACDDRFDLTGSWWLVTLFWRAAGDFC